MSFRQTALALIVAGAAAPAFAQTTGTWYPGELGFVPDVPKSQLTREQVKQDLATFVRDGGRVAAGEFGPVVPQRLLAGESSPTVMGAPAAPAQPAEPFVNGGPN